MRYIKPSSWRITIFYILASAWVDQSGHNHIVWYKKALEEIVINPKHIKKEIAVSIQHYSKPSCHIKPITCDQRRTLVMEIASLTSPGRNPTATYA